MRGTTKPPKLGAGTRVRLVRDISTNAGRLYERGAEGTLSVYTGGYNFEAKDGGFIRNLQPREFEVLEECFPIRVKDREPEVGDVLRPRLRVHTFATIKGKAEDGSFLVSTQVNRHYYYEPKAVPTTLAAMQNWAYSVRADGGPTVRYEKAGSAV